jgi:hypothetical protein
MAVCLRHILASEEWEVACTADTEVQCMEGQCMAAWDMVGTVDTVEWVVSADIVEWEILTIQII